MMAEKNQSPYPLAPVANGHTRSDEESVTAAAQSKELKKKKRIKCLVYILAFAVFQTGIILLFALTVMRFENPKFRIGNATLEASDFGTENASSFNLKLNTHFTVKNTNFGHFKYEDGTVTFTYGDAIVGNVTLQKGRARARSTKKVDLEVNLKSNGPLVNTEVLQLSIRAKLEGKIHLMKVIKKKKSAEMNCTMDIVTATKEIDNITCK
ncbi:hypothetical protein SLEP1_g3386 [Rubroshorea leprosula]|uniref:Late embryogenesis abundant protein LEA-2 subgroup domain-containing protein n=1 Tax=Rubroshorea leprosula TaxID=152421 RepID=A0AAV5HQY5_9ROSI|nr:hypothetical protein SLEP1_g3386 [Rubroshorea leprosula]